MSSSEAWTGESNSMIWYTSPGGRVLSWANRPTGAILKEGTVSPEAKRGLKSGPKDPFAKVYPSSAPATTLSSAASTAPFMRKLISTSLSSAETSASRALNTLRSVSPGIMWRLMESISARDSSIFCI